MLFYNRLAQCRTVTNLQSVKIILSVKWGKVYRYKMSNEMRCVSAVLQPMASSYLSSSLIPEGLRKYYSCLEQPPINFLLSTSIYPSYRRVNATSQRHSETHFSLLGSQRPMFLFFIWLLAATAIFHMFE